MVSHEVQGLEMESQREAGIGKGVWGRRAA
jgi:hypothetical protein